MNWARANEATALTLGSSSTATRHRASMESRCLLKCAAIRAYSECESGGMAGLVQGQSAPQYGKRSVRQAWPSASAACGPASPYAALKPGDGDQQRDQIGDRKSPPNARQAERRVTREQIRDGYLQSPLHHKRQGHGLQ